MELAQLSNKRGIYSIYDGSQYIIYSTYYGVVAKSTKIDRKEIRDENGFISYEDAIIDFDICRWYGYWDLKSIISRGLNKLENRIIKTNLKLNYHTIEGTDNSLENKYYLDIKLAER